MLAGGGRARRRPAQDRLAEHLPVGLGVLKQTLAVVDEQGAEPLARSGRREVLVRGAVGEVRREAVGGLAAEVDRVDGHTRGQLARARLREDGARQPVAVEERGEEIVELGMET